MSDFIRYNGIFPPPGNLVKLRSGIGYLYLITFCNGRLKFGKTKEVRARIKHHQESYFNYTGGKIENVIILGPYLDMAKAEKEFLTILKTNKILPIASNEWFLEKQETITNLFPKMKSKLFYNGILSNFQKNFLDTFGEVRDILTTKQSELKSLHSIFVEKNGKDLDFYSFLALLFEFDEFRNVLNKINYNIRKSVV